MTVTTDGMSADEWTVLRDRVDRIVASWSVPGGVAVVTNRHGDVFTHPFGFADIERGVPTSPSHLFQIGSISKLFTAAVVLHLVDQGDLRLDQPIGEVLDWVPPVLAGARIEHLLQHTAGLVSGIDAVPDQLAQVAGYTGGVSDAAPGTFFHYSNLGFILAGLAVERVTGRPLGELVRQLVFDPLGMHDSIATVTNGDFDRLARGYRAVVDDAPWLPGDAQRVADWLEADGADGSIAATATDLARFVRMLLGRGAGLGDPTVIERMMTALAPEGEDCVSLEGLQDVDVSRYGLGINVETIGDRTVLSHGGGMVGYASFALADLDVGIGVVVLTNANGTGPIAEVIARVIAAELISHAAPPELDPALWSEGDADGNVRPRSVMPSMLGRFVAILADGTEADLLVTLGGHESGLTRVEIEVAGERHGLLWSWSEAMGTRHPVLCGFPLHFDGLAWTWNDRVYRRTAVSAPVATGSPWAGHYRTYSPWFPNFRVVEREGVLLAISTPAVESPADEVELVQLAPGVFRLGSDHRRPERLTFGPVIDGVAAWVDRDGCRYSRSFLD